MERYIAIDNVCAWPNLTMMPDGSVIATIFNQPVHGKWEGDVDCWVTRNNGKNWTFHGRPAPHEPGTNRMNVAAGLARDNSLIVIASGWNDRPPVGATEIPPFKEIIAPWVCRSRDGGKTWERTETVKPHGKSGKIVPFGDIVQMSDGNLGVSFYGWQSPEEMNAYFYISRDDGRTWEMRSVIQNNLTETTVIALPSGNLLAAARTRHDQHLELFNSDDNGQTWKGLGAHTNSLQHPAHLLILKDGRVLMTYGIRHRWFFYGVGARISSDEGKTWGEPRLLVQFEDPQSQPPIDCGYPSDVQFADGTIMTAYYVNRVAAHARYHMGVVLWKVED